LLAHPTEAAMLTASRTVNEVRFILGDAPFSLLRPGLQNVILSLF
jgi:hypothetical protein